MSGQSGNCGEKGEGGATVDGAAAKPDNSFIAGLKRLAKERRAANDGENKERAAATAAGGETDKLDGGNRDQLGRAECRSNNPAADEDGAIANGSAVANTLKVEDIPDMTGKVISVSTENQSLRSASNINQPQSKQQQRRRDDSKQRSKKKSGTNPKKKPTSTSKLEDSSLPDMTGKEILVEQVELPSIEPVKKEIDLDDLILEEQSASTNKRRNAGASTTAAGSEGTSKSVNRRGPMSRSRSKSILTNSTTSEGSAGGSRCQLFATYNDQSQKSLQTQTTVGTSGNFTHDYDSDSPKGGHKQILEPPQLISSYSPYSKRLPVNSRRDRGVTSLHLSFQHSKPTRGKILSGKILPDVDEEDQSKSSLDINSTKSMPSRAQSWTNLIAMDEHSKRASMEKIKMEDVEEEESFTSLSFNPRKTSGLRTSRTSIVTEGSVNSCGSRESGSRRSKHSKRSTCDSLSRNRRRKASTSETWKNESTNSVLPTLSQMKDPEYIRTQATERFERGLDYAEVGKLNAARERFLVALRYRVMDRGSLHPDVAATHEMLGFVEYFLAENEKNDSFEGNLIRLDEGDDGLLGGNLTIMENPDKDSQTPSSSRGKNHYEKAAMHFQTALDILDAKEIGTGHEKTSTLTNDAISKDETTFQWKELAETYSILDERGRLGVEERIDIVSRIQERMDELPVTVGEKSYATSFLLPFNK